MDNVEGTMVGGWVEVEIEPPSFSWSDAARTPKNILIHLHLIRSKISLKSGFNFFSIKICRTEKPRAIPSANAANI